MRKLFESLAQTRPLVVVFDDLQWAEPTFIDLVDHLARSHARRSRCCCSASRDPSCSTSTGTGAAASDTPRRCRSSRWGRRRPAPDHEPARRPAASGRRPDEDRRRSPRGTRSSPRSCSRCSSTRSASAGRHRWVVAGDLEDLRVPQTINAFLAARLESLPKRRAHAARAWSRSRARSFTTARSASSRPNCRSPSLTARPRDARPPRPDPAGPLELLRRRGVPVPAHPHSRRRVRVALEDDAGGASTSGSPTWLERAAGRSHPRVRGDRRLSLRAGVPLPQGHRLGGRGAAAARCERLRAARVGRTQGARPQRSPGGDSLARKSGGARDGRWCKTRATASGARSGAHRDGQRGKRARSRDDPRGSATARRAGRRRLRRRARRGPAADPAGLS